MSPGTCPKCGQAVTRAVLEPCEIGPLMGPPTYKGVQYICQNMGCRAVLGVGIDPIAIEEDIVNRVIDGLMKRLKK